MRRYFVAAPRFCAATKSEQNFHGGEILRPHEQPAIWPLKKNPGIKCLASSPAKEGELQNNLPGLLAKVLGKTNF